MTEDLEFNIIEVPKMYKGKQENEEKLIEWLKFLENPESKEVQGYRKIAKKMKDKGKDIREIIEITGLSEEEINKL